MHRKCLHCVLHMWHSHLECNDWISKINLNNSIVGTVNFYLICHFKKRYGNTNTYDWYMLDENSYGYTIWNDNLRIFTSLHFLITLAKYICIIWLYMPTIILALPSVAKPIFYIILIIMPTGSGRFVSFAIWYRAY